MITRKITQTCFTFLHFQFQSYMSRNEDSNASESADFEAAQTAPDHTLTRAAHDLRAPLIELIPDVSHTSGPQIYLHPLCTCAGRVAATLGAIGV